MDGDENEETTSVSNFFSKRAKLLPKVSAEGLKAASELIREIKKEQVPSKIKRSRVPASKANPKGKKAVPDIDEFLVEKIEIESPSVPDIELSASAKRRLKKSEQERRLELLRIEADNEKILSVVNADVTQNTVAEVVIEEEFDELTILTISYMSQISRIRCYKNEKFSSIFPRIAELYKLKVSEFLLCHKEYNIIVDDTPESLNLKSCDILDCIPYKADENMETNDEYDDNKLKIFFQTSYGKEKISIMVHKVEKMQDIMIQYSKLQGLPLNDFAFEFDGERIMGTETAEDLDMETGSCIDVIVFNPSIQMTSSKKKGLASTDNYAISSSVDCDRTSSVNCATPSFVNNATSSSVNNATSSSVNNATSSSVINATTSSVNHIPSSPENSISSSENSATTPLKKRAAKRRTPASAKKQTPAKSRKQTPAKSRKRTPAKSRKRTPAKSRKRTPAKSRMRAPPVKSRKRASRGKEAEAFVTIDSDSCDTDILSSETSDILILD